MAPVAKYVKALFLGLVSKSKWRPSKSRNAKRRQVFDVGDLSQEWEKKRHHPPKGSPEEKWDDDLLDIFGSIGTISTVFLGQLSDGSQIAVKRLDMSRMKDVKEFAAEAKTLGSIRHKNLLSLRGFCAEGKQRLIVYDYMVNLSLHAHLHGSLSSSLVLSWSKRMSIAIGAADGLAHLHHRTAPEFVHGDIKSSNVLLDGNLEAKWADFGLMRFMQEGCGGFGLLNGGGKGMAGYSAPEYSQGAGSNRSSGPSQSGDVFGFGILLLELVSGKKPTEKVGYKGDHKTMWEWAEPLIAEGRYSELIDPRLRGRYARDALNLIVYVATMCAQSNPSSRLTMAEACELLKCGGVCGGSMDDIEFDP